MLKTLCTAVLASGLMGGLPAVTHAADQDRTQLQTQDRDRIYGSQLMTQRERDQYRAQMRTAKNEQERERVRAEHHERMTERARERGVNLPDGPPARGNYGGGMGPGAGGSGMGGGGRGR